MLETLAAHSLFAKKSKCKFESSEIEYFKHLVSAKVVKIYLYKIQSIVNWPVPNSLKFSRGFLGLTRCYERFMKHYRLIAAPLTALLKKNSFQWTTIIASKAFEELKASLTNP